jgi:hypothetical protein
MTILCLIWQPQCSKDSKYALIVADHGIVGLTAYQLDGQTGGNGVVIEQACDVCEEMFTRDVSQRRVQKIPSRTDADVRPRRRCTMWTTSTNVT